MATQPYPESGHHGPPSRPTKLTYIVGAVLLILFFIFVLSQSATLPGAQ